MAILLIKAPQKLESFFGIILISLSFNLQWCSEPRNSNDISLTLSHKVLSRMTYNKTMKKCFFPCSQIIDTILSSVILQSQTTATKQNLIIKGFRWQMCVQVYYSFQFEKGVVQQILQ